MRHLVWLVIGVLAATAAVTAQPRVDARALDTAAIEQALGRTGEWQKDGVVYKLGLPRTDLQVTVAGVKVRPGLALGSWIAFRSTAQGAIAHGDLVLLEDEIDRVISKLFEGGLEITALHNHVLRETPSVMYLHFWGRGSEAQLAKGLRAALDATKTPPPPSSPPAAPGGDGFDAERIQQVLGHKGTLRGGVLGIAIARRETITMMGVELPPSMGMATALNFQAAGAGKVVATGDYVLTAEEVNPVAKALRQHGAGITSLHSHMIHGEPVLHFMHFWAHDTADRVAAALKAGLDAMNGKHAMNGNAGGPRVIDFEKDAIGKPPTGFSFGHVREDDQGAVGAVERARGVREGQLVRGELQRDAPLHRGGRDVYEAGQSRVVDESGFGDALR